MSQAVVIYQQAGAIENLRDAREAAREFAANSKAPNTIKAYRSDWAAFSTWSQEHGVQALPASGDTVALYIAFLANESKVATIRRRLVSIGEAHRAAGLEVPTGGASVKAVLAGIRREKGSAQTRKAPAVTDVIKLMVEALPSGLAGLRDRALLLLGFAGAFRRSELVGLLLEDVEFSRDGAIITLRRSKTDQAGEGERIGIPYGSHPETCPVRNLSSWISASGITSGPLFRSIDRHGNLALEALTGTSVALIVKKVAQAAGLDPSEFSGHSLRAGFATSAAAADVPEHRIMRQTRHKSRAIMDRYIREANIFKKNAASSVGL